MQEFKVEILQEIAPNNIRIKDKNTFFSSFSFFIFASIDLIRALLVRLVFIGHILMAVIMVSFIHNDMWYMVNYKLIK